MTALQGYEKFATVDFNKREITIYDGPIGRRNSCNSLEDMLVSIAALRQMNFLIHFFNVPEPNQTFATSAKKV